MAHVAFLWHMHQPYYVDPATNAASMPWVRVHCAKGYLDMISTVAEYPAIRANFNLTPVLLLQIRELLDGRIQDEWLELARRPAAELSEQERVKILENFFKANWDYLVRPHARYWELLNKRGLTFYGEDVRRGVRYFSVQEILDLQVWFNLTWCGYTLCRLYPELEELKRKGRGFTEEEKQRVLELHLEAMRLVLQRYRQASEEGRVELTTTPFFHPILPLIYDTAFAERAMPGRTFPRRFSWPADAETQVTLAVEQHAAIFGSKPRGLWPAEGAVAPELIPIMQRAGIEYFCSDEENLFASLKIDPEWKGVNVDHLELFQGWRIQYDGAEVNAVFRERPLSDFIGFNAARNEPGQAALHLLFHLRHISELIDHRGLIPLILDGENAWEFFHDGGESFLRAFYGGIEADRDRIASTTLGDYLQAHPPERRLTTLHTGSWIGSNLDVWIGEPEENRAWEVLGETRAWFQERLESGELNAESEAAARKSLYAAEGSDWFWWYGPDFTTENDRFFDQLFRAHLRAVYHACGSAAPAVLEVPITARGGEPPHRLPTQFITPVVNGSRASFYEWNGAGSYVPAAPSAIVRFYFGNDESTLYLRVDFARAPSGTLMLQFIRPKHLVIRAALDGPGERPLQIQRSGEEVVSLGICAADELVELALPLATLGVELPSDIAFQLRLLNSAGALVECHPPGSTVHCPLLGEDWALANWMV
jgi:alpha-amylase/alpha-mannosidase (GH57 family)